MQRRILLILLAVIVGVAFFFRAAYLWRDLVFVYDQGRDAQIVQEILHGKLTFIGPTTGLDGVYLGPFYFYFLVLPYVVGGGNPIIPAYFFIALLSVTCLAIFWIGNKIAGKKAGIVAAALFAASISQVQFARWLSNPTTLPFFATLAWICLYFSLEKRKALFFGLTGILFGICLQLEAANALFFLPAVAIVMIMEIVIGWNHDKKTKRSSFVQWFRSTWLFPIMALSIGFLFTFLPQGLFELRHGFISTKALMVAMRAPKEVSLPSSIPRRIALLVDLFSRAWFWRHSWTIPLFALTIIGAILGFIRHPEIRKQRLFRLLCCWFFVPLIAHILYTGNHGNFWDYYIIAQHIPLYLLVTVLYMRRWNKTTLVIIPFFCFLIFSLAIGSNLITWTEYRIPYTERLSLSLQLDAIHWIVAQQGNTPFGVHIYTPNLLDNAYRYLISYQAKKTGILPQEHAERVEDMYLIVEDDPGRAKIRANWIAERSHIGEVVEIKKFGAVSVYKLKRKIYGY